MTPTEPHETEPLFSFHAPQLNRLTIRVSFLSNGNDRFPKRDASDLQSEITSIPAKPSLSEILRTIQRLFLIGKSMPSVH